MVSTKFVVKVLVAFAPLTCVFAQYGSPALPLLLDATTEELSTGLEAGDFSSVDLVNVSILAVVHRCAMILLDNELISIRLMSGAYWKSTRHFIWSPKLTQMLGQSRKSLMKSVLVASFEGAFLSNTVRENAN